MNNYLQAYLKNRPLFLTVIRAPEAKLFHSKLPLKEPILDFGCGDGFFAKVAFGNKQKIDVGLDIDKKSLKEAENQKIYSILKLFDGKKIPFLDSFFGTIISNSVLEHVKELDIILTEINRVLKPGGKFIFTVMTDNWERYLFGNLVLGNVYKKWMRKKQKHQYLLTYKDWIKKIKIKGFKIQETQGYLDKRASRWMDILHYVSVGSLISYKLSGKWVLFSSQYDVFPVEGLLKGLINKSISPDKSASIFIVAKKSS